MKTTACILLLAAAAWGQELAVPQGGSLGPSCNLSDAATLGADKLDGSHASATPTANAVPVASGNGRLAAGWIPLPTTSSIGGIFMNADCLAGNHVSGIDVATGQLKCSADNGGGGLGGTVTQNKILLAASTTTAGDSAMTQTAGTDITSTLKVKAPSFEGTATSDQSLTLPAVTSEAVSGAGQAKLIAKNNQLQLSVNAGPFAALGANLPPGANTQLPYNNNGVWGVLSGFSINPATGEMQIPGPISPTGTSQIANITEATCTASVSGKGKVMFNSATHRPCYSYNAGTPSDAVLQSDASVTSSANAIVKQDATGKLDDTVLPAPTATTLGGVMSKAAETGKCLTAINTDGSVANASCGGSGGGAFTKIYDTRFTTQRTDIASTTMVTPALDVTYQFSASFTQMDAGTGCSTNPNVSMTLNYTDADTSVSRNVLTLWTRSNAANVNSIDLSRTTITQANYAASAPYTIRVKASTAVTFSVTYNLNAAACSTWPAYNLTPLLVQVN